MTEINDIPDSAYSHAVEERFARLEWMREARASFAPSARQPCEVCGKYRALAQAHHVVPLALQSGTAPNHSHVWLCPTHHAAVHLLISQCVSGRERAGRWQIDLIAEMDADELDKVWAVFDRYRSRA